MITLLNHHRNSHRLSSVQSQRGVLLIVTMILLLVISGVAAIAIKGTSSTEAVANNARTQGLAMQAAEAALRYAEIGVFNQNYTDNAKPLPANKPTHLFAIATAVPVGTETWKDETKWDGTASTSTTISRAALDGATGVAICSTSAGRSDSTGSFCAVYKRDPECMAQYADATKRFAWVTCRGFGPDVAATADKGFPSGAEVFLQSIIRLPF
jgi:type IV pilus assembly protein PilX